ncbi:hypothetical protein MHK_010085 [Candidatus Magnetomorum sp. HK-1]|nr:hypothetical protein MHK_010085 [Candidatus Magnetomorum sp. HK-1]
MKKIICIELLFIMFFIPVQGLTMIINVPGDYATIQEGLNAASEGDTVQVAPGRYIENISWPGVNGIKLIGGGDDTIIDGDRSGSVISFKNAVIQSETIVQGFKITNGSAYEGGGIYCSNSSPNLSNVTITGNTANWDGGGIYCSNSRPSLSNVTISGNTANDGGGIYCIRSSTIIFDNENRCNIYANSALSGSDIYSEADINIIVDTFTVKTPTSYYASPIENTFQLSLGDYPITKFSYQSGHVTLYF